MGGRIVGWSEKRSSWSGGATEFLGRVATFCVRVRALSAAVPVVVALEETAGTDRDEDLTGPAARVVAGAGGSGGAVTPGTPARSLGPGGSNSEIPVDMTTAR